MIIIKKTVGNETIVSVAGKIDSVTYGELNDYLDALDYTDLNLTLDFTDVPYITSAGIRTLFICRKKLPYDRMRVINADEYVIKILDSAGVLGSINVSAPEKTADENIQNRTLKEILADRVRDYPDKVIFARNGQEYTWRDVDICSQIIANDLHKMGVADGSHVAVFSKNTINWILTFFAIQKLGAVAVLLNHELKDNELCMYAELGDITHFCYGNIPQLRKESLVTALKAQGIIEYFYDIGDEYDYRKRFGEYDKIKDRYKRIYDPDDPGIMLFTSGTTGKPKGVLSSARNYIISSEIMSDKMNITSEDRICNYLPYNHMFGFAFNLMTAVIRNAVMYMPESRYIPLILETIEKKRCTVFHSVPTMLVSMVHHPDFRPEKVKSVRCTIVGGAAITPPQLTELKNIMPNDGFINVYGMSEVCPITSTEYGDSDDHLLNTIGKPVKGVEVEIRDPATHEVCPIGVDGEITARAENLLTCYYKLDISKQPLGSDGWIPTGDRGRLLPDGYIKLTGRIKDLIIRGGENISPGEIANIISEMDEIEDVKVLGVPDELFGEEVAAALVIKAGSTFDEEKIKKYLSGRLATFKIPKYFAVYEEFRLLANGKVDMLYLKKDICEKLGK